MILRFSFLHLLATVPRLTSGIDGVEAARLGGLPQLSRKAFVLLVLAFDDVDVSAVPDASRSLSDTTRVRAGSVSPNCSLREIEGASCSAPALRSKVVGREVDFKAEGSATDRLRESADRRSFLGSST